MMNPGTRRGISSSLEFHSPTDKYNCQQNAFIKRTLLVTVLLFSNFYYLSMVT